jgi:hypothetical protein
MSAQTGDDEHKKVAIFKRMLVCLGVEDEIIDDGRSLFLFFFHNNYLIFFKKNQKINYKTCVVM